MGIRKATLEQYASKDGFRWRLRAVNGKTIADSAEAYTTFYGLRRAVKSVIAAFRSGVIVVSEKGLDD